MGCYQRCRSFRWKILVCLIHIFSRGTFIGQYEHPMFNFASAWCSVKCVCMHSAFVISLSHSRHRQVMLFHPLSLVVSVSVFDVDAAVSFSFTSRSESPKSIASAIESECEELSSSTSPLISIGVRVHKRSKTTIASLICGGCVYKSSTAAYRDVRKILCEYSFILYSPDIANAVKPVFSSDPDGCYLAPSSRTILLASCAEYPVLVPHSRQTPRRCTIAVHIYHMHSAAVVHHLLATSVDNNATISPATKVQDHWWVSRIL